MKNGERDTPNFKILKMRFSLLIEAPRKLPFHFKNALFVAYRGRAPGVSFRGPLYFYYYNYFSIFFLIYFTPNIVAPMVNFWNVHLEPFRPRYRFFRIPKIEKKWLINIGLVRDRHVRVCVARMLYSWFRSFG